MEDGLVAVEVDEEGGAGGAVGEAAAALRHQARVRLLVEHRLERRLRLRELAELRLASRRRRGWGCVSMVRRSSREHGPHRLAVALPERVAAADPGRESAPATSRRARRGMGPPSDARRASACAGQRLPPTGVFSMAARSAPRSPACSRSGGTARSGSPEAGTSMSRKSRKSRGVMVSSTWSWSIRIFSISTMRCRRATAIPMLALVHRLLAEEVEERVQLVQDLLEPQLVDLVDHDEEHLVVGGPPQRERCAGPGRRAACPASGTPRSRRAGRAWSWGLRRVFIDSTGAGDGAG